LGWHVCWGRGVHPKWSQLEKENPFKIHPTIRKSSCLMVFKLFLYKIVDLLKDSKNFVDNKEIGSPENLGIDSIVLIKF